MLLRYQLVLLSFQLVSRNSCFTISLTEFLALKMLYNNKLVIVTVIYRSPSQSSQEFVQFEILFSQLLIDITLKKHFFPLFILGDFNARSKCWWSFDKKSKESDSLFLISSTSGYTRLINSATHTIGNSSSCIDLIIWLPRAGFTLLHIITATIK